MKNSNTCNICGKSFVCQSKLKRHVDGVQDCKKDHKCVECNKAFTQKSVLNVHIKRVHEEKSAHEDKSVHEDRSVPEDKSVHEDKSEKIFRCMKCGAVFSSIGNRNRHVKTIHPEVISNSNNDQIPKIESDQKNES